MKTLSGTILRFFILLVISTPASSDEFKINASDSIKDSKALALMTSILNRVYEDAGHSIQFVQTTRERETLLLERGELDAVVARYREIGDNTPYLRRVEPAVLLASPFIICMKQENCDYKNAVSIGYAEAFQFAGTFCEQQKLSCKKYSSYLGLQRALVYGMVDAVIGYDIDMSAYEKFAPDEQVFVKTLNELSRESYHYLQVNNKRYAKELGNSIANLHENGVIDSLYKAFLSERLAHQNIRVLD